MLFGCGAFSPLEQHTTGSREHNHRNKRNSNESNLLPRELYVKFELKIYIIIAGGRLIICRKSVYPVSAFNFSAGCVYVTVSILSMYMKRS